MDAESYKIWIGSNQIDVPTDRDFAEFTLYSTSANLKANDIVYVRLGYSYLEEKKIYCKALDLGVLGSIEQQTISTTKEQLPKLQKSVITYLPFTPEMMEDTTIPVWKISPYKT